MVSIARLAQSVGRQALNLVVVGSSLTVGWSSATLCTCAHNRRVTSFVSGLESNDPLQEYRNRCWIGYSVFCGLVIMEKSQLTHCAKIQMPQQFYMDTLAQLLRRRPAKPMGSPRVGSNPTGAVYGNIQGSRTLFDPRTKYTKDPNPHISERQAQP